VTTKRLFIEEITKGPTGAGVTEIWEITDEMMAELGWQRIPDDAPQSDALPPNEISRWFCVAEAVEKLVLRDIIPDVGDVPPGPSVPFDIGPRPAGNTVHVESHRQCSGCGETPAHVGSRRPRGPWMCAVCARRIADVLTKTLGELAGEPAQLPPINGKILKPCHAHAEPNRNCSVCDAWGKRERVAGKMPSERYEEIVGNVNVGWLRSHQAILQVLDGQHRERIASEKP